MPAAICLFNNSVGQVMQDRPALAERPAQSTLRARGVSLARWMGASLSNDSSLPEQLEEIEEMWGEEMDELAF